MSRIFTAIASPVLRDRVHECRLAAGERRQLTAAFRALVPAGVTITRAQWDMPVASDVAMSDGRIAGTSSSVMIEALRSGGGGEVRCTASLSNGDALVQYFAVLVACAPAFATGGASGGPTQIVVTA